MAPFADYILFFAKTLTTVIAILLLVAGMCAIVSKAKRQRKGQLIIEKVNKHYDEMREQLNTEILSKRSLKTWHKEQEKIKRATDKKLQDQSRPRLYVIRFNGDIKASAVSALREEITAILTVAKPADEVVINLESTGGMVHAYGLAASQLQRLRDKGIPMTVIIDKVAASGGYLMACVANKILAAPFAIIGSIGVVAQLPNFHRLLKKNDIDFEQITAGQFKRTLTVFGENTEQGRKKFQEDVETIHQLFKNYILQYRPDIEIERVATGEYWPGVRALELNLIDAISTTDDYLLDASRINDIYEIQYRTRKSLSEKLAGSVELVIQNLLSLWQNKAEESKLL